MAKNDGGPAFPGVHDGMKPQGMTIRQYYKAAALQGLLATGDYAFYGESLEVNVRAAGRIADAMIDEDTEAAKP